MRAGMDTAKAVAQIPSTTVRLPKYATWRKVNLFIIGPLIRPRLHIIVPLRWRIRLVCVAVIPRAEKRSAKIRPKHCWIGSTASWWEQLQLVKVSFRISSIRAVIVPYVHTCLTFAGILHVTEHDIFIFIKEKKEKEKKYKIKYRIIALHHIDCCNAILRLWLSWFLR